MSEKCPKCHFEYRKGGLCFCNTTGAPAVILDIQPHYNRGLGSYVTGRSDYRSQLKEKNLIEIGNERKYIEPETLRKNTDKKIDKEFESLRKPAMEMLNAWN